ncbi:MAG: LysR family glycine cleavage system transcriptional activator [Neolewinella sp.]|jgi:LysR family glycine cleavage system transcriptional activator
MTTILRLPPFPALRGFEAAARLQSFRLASEELCLSPSAISHHVRQLETFLGSPLFERSPNGVTLTQSGQNYFSDLAPILETLENATNQAIQNQPRQQILLQSSSGFAARWLMPRLCYLKRCAPNADLTLTTNQTSNSSVDIEFKCAHTHPLEGDDEVLLSTVRAPVCSAQYLKENGPIENSFQLQNHTLIREHQWDCWDEWFSITMPEHSIEAAELWFDDGYASMSAVELSLGVQLGYLELLADGLSDGRLIRLFDQAIPKKTLFTLRMKTGWRNCISLIAIRKWLLEEAHNAEKAVN